MKFFRGLPAGLQKPFPVLQGGNAEPGAESAVKGALAFEAGIRRDFRDGLFAARNQADRTVEADALQVFRKAHAHFF